MAVAATSNAAKGATRRHAAAVATHQEAKAEERRRKKEREEEEKKKKKLEEAMKACSQAQTLSMLFVKQNLVVLLNQSVYFRQTCTSAPGGL